MLLYYPYARYNHWEKMGEPCMKPLPTIFATSHKSVIISKYKVFTNRYCSRFKYAKDINAI